MKRLIPFAFVLAALAVPSVAKATPMVTITDAGTPSYLAANASGGGGAFVATLTGGNPGFLSGPVGTGLTADQFITFCLELTEHIGYGTPYTYTWGPAAIGGAGGAVSGQDPLSAQTMWIYASFMNNIAVFGSSGAVGAAIQNAVWYLENEIGSIDATAQNIVNSANSAITAAGGTFAGTSLYGLGYRVSALNLTTGTTNNQSMLVAEQVFVPETVVPEPASLLLLGSGLALVARRARRRSNA